MEEEEEGRPSGRLHLLFLLLCLVTNWIWRHFPAPNHRSRPLFYILPPISITLKRLSRNIPIKTSQDIKTVVIPESASFAIPGNPKDPVLLLPSSVSFFIKHHLLLCCGTWEPLFALQDCVHVFWLSFIFQSRSSIRLPLLLPVVNQNVVPQQSHALPLTS